MGQPRFPGVRPSEVTGSGHCGCHLKDCCASNSPYDKSNLKKKAFVLVILMVGFLRFGLVLFFSLFKGITVHHGTGGGGTMGQLVNAGSWLPCCLSHFIPDHGTMLSICSECVFLPSANLSGNTLLDIPRGVF